MLKVLLINHSDTQGGASVVSYRLMNALCSEGVDARMLVMHKNTSSLRVADATKEWKAKIPFLEEHAEIFFHNGFNRETLFKISTARYGLPLEKHPWVRNADIVILNWINQGMLSLNGIQRIAKEKPVIWIMHDMWNMTGVCHFNIVPEGKTNQFQCCQNYMSSCRDCPLVKGSFAEKVFDRKKNLYSIANIQFVAVSNYLAQLCRQSPLMQHSTIKVIPNALPVEKFGISPKLSRRDIGVPTGRRLIVMGASRLDDPVKNLPLAIESLNLLKQTDVTAVFYGHLRNPEILESLRIPYVWLGVIDNQDSLQSLMAHSDIVLSTSLWETLPGTLVEGIAAGAVAVCTSNGGQADIITEGVTGFLCENSCNMIAENIERALKLPFTPESRQRRHDMMNSRFGAHAVAHAYLREVQSSLRRIRAVRAGI